MSVPLLICIIGCDVMVITSIKAALLLADIWKGKKITYYVCTYVLIQYYIKKDCNYCHQWEDLYNMYLDQVMNY